MSTYNPINKVSISKAIVFRISISKAIVLLLLLFCFPVVCFDLVWERMCAQLLSVSTLFDPMDGSPSGPSVHRIILARVLESVAISSSRRSA